VSVGTFAEGVIGADVIVGREGPDAIDSDGGLGAIGKCCPVICPCCAKGIRPVAVKPPGNDNIGLTGGCSARDVCGGPACEGGRPGICG
jgi:hypothetical protein